MRYFLPSFCIMILGLAIHQCQALDLPALFSDHMVLQQKQAAPFWGIAAPNEQVTIAASWGKSGQTRADAQGRWRLAIKTPKAGGPYTVTISGEKEKKILQDVLIGEVWLCSGQSNMEMPLMGWPPGDPIENSKEAIAAAQLPLLRLCTVQHAVSAVPLSDCSASWSPCTPETAKNFSATAFFFGRTLVEQLHIPVGLIHSSWGGTFAQSWINGEFLKTMPEFAAITEKIRSNSGEIGQYQKWLEQHRSFSVNDKNEDARWIDLDFGDRACSQADYADQEWRTMSLPIFWEKTEMGEFDGAIWFRRTIDIPTSWAGKHAIVELGPIDDMDITFINGELIGKHEQTGFWQTERKYNVPGSLLRPGKNVIAVRVVDNQGGGGIYGKPEQMKIYPADQLDEKINLAGEWKYLPVAEYRAGTFYMFSTDPQEYFKHPAVSIEVSPNTPTFLYNAMIAPLVPYRIKGAIWYQGESNTGNPKQYRTLFPLLIANWRHDWGLKDMPFYFVQIAPWEYGAGTRSQELREAQMLSMAVPHSGMAVTLDIGDVKSIHPANKHDVGKRLALWALAKDYGKKVAFSGPIYQSIKIENDAIRISFKYCGSGLVAGKKGLTGFEVAGADRQFQAADAVIIGNKVLVKATNVIKPIAVRYAWSNTASASLFNKEGLPASSFRSDDWD